ncbi:MAG: RNA methyltransferase [Rhizobiales bacterium]|nr:RNA methyltransferase [Hyphomicrobiales bacterium]
MNDMKAPVVILVRPQLAENIGMCARAMANFGLSEMRLVSPRDGWPQKAQMKKGAFSAAAGATHVLTAAKHFDTLDQAVADLHHVYATTARYREQAKPVEAPAKALADAASRVASGQKVGLMFGPERTGLESDEVMLASSIITFPVNPEYASLNLAQAVLLTGYEWMRASKGDVLPFSMPEESPPAQQGMVSQFFAFFEGELDRVRFFHPEAKKPVMVRNLRNMIHRMSPSEQDIRTLWGALDLLAKGGKQPGSKQKPKPVEDHPVTDA